MTTPTITTNGAAPEHVANPVRTKTIGYACPTSTSAKRFGFYHRGCYVVGTVNGIKPPVYSAGFATWKAAKVAADAMPGDFNRYSMEEPS